MMLVIAGNIGSPETDMFCIGIERLPDMIGTFISVSLPEAVISTAVLSSILSCGGYR